MTGPQSTLDTFGQGFNASGQTTLAVTNSSARVALPTTDNTVLVQNTGTVTAYVVLDASTATATTSNQPVLPGQYIILSAGPPGPSAAGYLAAITASSTTNLTITTGIGIPVVTTAGSSSSTIGNVGGKTVRVTVTPTVTATNSYGTNYVVGGLLTFANAFTNTGSGIIESVHVTCKKVESQGFTLTFFNANPSNTTWTDAAVANINAADVGSLKTTVPLTSSSVLGTCTVASADGLGIATSPGITSLYAVLTTNAALTNQFGSTSDITVTVTILQDL